MSQGLSFRDVPHSWSALHEQEFLPKRSPKVSRLFYFAIRRLTIFLPQISYLVTR